MKRMSVALMIAALCLTFGLASAFASKSIKTSVELAYEPGTYSDSFFGQVKSKNDRCQKNRKVKLRRQAQGPNVLVGSDTSDADGLYSVILGDYAESGDYYAKTPKRTLSNGKVCGEDRSERVVVP